MNFSKLALVLAILSALPPLAWSHRGLRIGSVLIASSRLSSFASLNTTYKHRLVLTLFSGSSLR